MLPIEILPQPVGNVAFFNVLQLSSVIIIISIPINIPFIHIQNRAGGRNHPNPIIALSPLAYWLLRRRRSLGPCVKMLMRLINPLPRLVPDWCILRVAIVSFIGFWSLEEGDMAAVFALNTVSISK